MATKKSQSQSQSRRRAVRAANRRSRVLNAALVLGAILLFVGLVAGGSFVVDQISKANTAASLVPVASAPVTKADLDAALASIPDDLVTKSDLEAAIAAQTVITTVNEILPDASGDELASGDKVLRTGWFTSTQPFSVTAPVSGTLLISSDAGCFWSAKIAKTCTYGTGPDKQDEGLVLAVFMNKGEELYFHTPSFGQSQHQSAWPVFLNESVPSLDALEAFQDAEGKPVLFTYFDGALQTYRREITP